MEYNPPKYRIRNILLNNKNWERYKLFYSDLEEWKIKEIERMLYCCNPNKGFFIGYCENCKEERILHFKCNGKACTRCGKAYADKWTKKAKDGKEYYGIPLP